MQEKEICLSDEVGFVSLLPVELWCWILSFLEAREILVTATLSKSLLYVSYDNVLWKRLCTSKLGISKLQLSTHMEWKDFYSKHRCYNGVWDSTNMGKMWISEDKLTVTHGGDFLGSYQCVRGTTPITAGVCYWEIIVDKLSSHQTGFHVVIGVVPTAFNFYNTYLSSNGGWGYLADGRKAHNSGNGGLYGSKYVQGDRVGVLVDLIAGTVTFYKNGESQGVAFREVTGPVYPAVSLLTGSQKVTLLQKVPFPMIY